MKRYFESIKPFFILIVSFVVLLFCVKTFELFSSGSIRFSYIVEMIYGNLVASLSLSLCVFVIYNIVSIFSAKAAFYVASILFSIIIISEIGLIFYQDTTGFLMGRELIERPLWETITTIRSVLNIWMILAAILFIAGYTFVNVKVVNGQQSTVNGHINVSLCSFVFYNET